VNDAAIAGSVTTREAIDIEAAVVAISRRLDAARIAIALSAPLGYAIAFAKIVFKSISP
jgi:hypothetical protein